MIKAQKFQHECIIYVSTCNISNKAELNYTFRDMDPLSLILELPPYILAHYIVKLNLHVLAPTHVYRSYKIEAMLQHDKIC